MDPGSLDRPDVAARPDEARPDSSRPAPGKAAPAAEDAPVAPAEAFHRGWMPLGETGADAFVRAHPTFDGRGVLIAILDSGIDAGVRGLATTSTGSRKILDLRDFSGEGSIPLAAVTPRGDAVTIGGRHLTGFGRVAGVAAGGAVYGGVLRERPLGAAPAADVNGNGSVTDALPVVVVRASDGWVLFADTDGDGSLANERPVHDYLAAHETFGWSTAGRPAPLTIAVNISGGSGTAAPDVDLVFDTFGHGTHVAGIAAGNDMYGVAGFDGVAPGAQLLGCKLANDALGGITTTGSMLRALDYAIRFAAERQLPLVVNMSFGVGNELEGTARIDALIDSVMAAHPDVVLTISAGNDGPGLSTLGFPASAARIISVGATLPAVFISADPSGRGSEPIAAFSSRGGELARPDIVTPGMAYSTVPRWDVNGAREGGTSMAAPHAAGLAALLESSLAAGARRPAAVTMRQALMVTARPIAGSSYLDQGAGLPDVGRAYRWLQDARDVMDVTVTAPGGRGSAAFQVVPRGSRPDTVQTFTIRSPQPESFVLRSSAAWAHAPARVVSTGRTASTVQISYDSRALAEPGVYTAVVTGWTRDTMAGPAFRLVNTVVIAYPGGAAVSLHATLPPAALRRIFFVADSERPFQVRVTSEVQGTTVYLHEPNGMPYRDGNGLPAGAGEQAAVYEVGARDVVPGVYEAVVAAPPGEGSQAQIDIVPAPVRLRLTRNSSGLAATFVSLADTAIAARAAVVVSGAERTQLVVAHGAESPRIPFVMPAWARRVTVEVAMDRAQWSRFTDFGVTVFDTSGAQLGQEPLNYALGRLEVPLPETHAAVPAELRLAPALAEPGSNESWTARVSIRLYGDSAITAPVVQGPVPADLQLARRGTATITFRLPTLPWALGDGFFPFGAVVALIGEHVWTREAGFAAPTPPVMR